MVLAPGLHEYLPLELDGEEEAEVDLIGVLVEVDMEEAGVEGAVVQDMFLILWLHHKLVLFNLKLKFMVHLNGGILIPTRSKQFRTSKPVKVGLMDKLLPLALFWITSRW